MDLALGTVQFGMSYGIENAAAPSAACVGRLLSHAVEKGITVFDTAQAYGTAESVLGHWLEQDPQLQNQVRVMSKTRPKLLDGVSPEAYYSILEQQVCDTLQKLHVAYLDAYLFHDEGYVYNEQALLALTALKNAGYVRQVGVSVYGIDEALAGVASPHVDLMQLPFNALDHRAAEQGVFNKAQATGTTLHVRSAFLQGLLLYDDDQLPAYLAHTRKALQTFHALTKCAGYSPAQLAIGYIHAQPAVARLVVGAQDIAQLDEIVAAFETRLPLAVVQDIDRCFTRLDETIILPTRWKKPR